MVIQLDLIGDINQFVQGSRFYEGEIYIEQDNQKVNAKSILGIYALDLSKPIHVTIDTNRDDIKENFYNFIRKWEVKENQ